MKVELSWTEHDRKYSIPLVEFLAYAKIEITENELKQIARKLLEQNEVTSG